MVIKGRVLSLRGALAVVFVNRYAVFAISFPSTMVLARLLTPAETGLFSVAASIVLLAQAIRDFGIGEFLIQEKDLTPAKIRTAFGMTLIFAWTIGGIIFVSRHRIAELYSTPELSGLIAIVSGSFLVAPFSSTVLALLNREMAFGVLFRISVASNLANTLVSITLAYLGWGATALTLGMLAMNVTTAVVASASARSWDHIIPSLREWRALASFGAYMSGANVVNQISARAPDLIIGRLLGYQTLGIYNRAGGVVSLFYEVIVSSVQTVAFPAFAAARRAGEDIREPYLRTVTLVTGAVLPVFGLLAIDAVPLVKFLLGDQWLEAAHLIPFITAGVAAEAMAPMVSAFLSAVGWVRMLLRLALYIRIAQVATVAVFANFGLWWLLVGSVSFATCALFVNALMLRRCIGLRVSELLRASLPSYVVGGLTVILPFAVLGLRAADHDPAWLSLTIGFGLGGASWLGAITALRHPLRRELEALLREMLMMLRRSAA